MTPQSVEPMTAREEIDSLGWVVVHEQEPSVRDFGDELLQKIPGKFSAEYVGSVGGHAPRTHHLTASSLELLLQLCQEFMERREALGAHGPQIEHR
jgi:hypothetical protein